MSLQNSHTPGPWFATWNHQDVKGADAICHIYPESQRGDRFQTEVAVMYCARPGTEQEANAHLLAAAPQMLAALKAVAGAQCVADKVDALLLVCDAIDRAEGRA